MKMLFLPKYDYAGASSRYRTHQFIPFFRERKISCDVESFFDYAHIQSINISKRGTKLNFLYFILKRFLLIFKARQYDLLFIEKELIPYFPSVIETILKWQGVKFILDYDDAVFHNYDQNSNPLIRFILKNKIPVIIKKADYVVAGSAYLREFALKFNKNVIKIPTVIDIEVYSSSKNTDRKKEFIIGWIGSFYTSRYVNQIMDVLKDFAGKHDCKINLIGYNKKLLPEDMEDFVRVIEWDAETEVEEIRKFSVGISPTEDSYFSRGKCAFKSVQYMACGIPVIATPVGANGEIVRHNENGFHASTPSEWYQYLEFFYLNRDKIKEFGEKNRRIVENEYCVQSRLEEYIEVFDTVLNSD
jgi:glycosyltransferase involved in cell wall biosynthesis